MNKILCHSCSSWVDCSKNGEKKGFCLICDLFTYTAEERCSDYSEGKPMTEAQYEGYQYSEILDKGQVTEMN